MISKKPAQAQATATTLNKKILEEEVYKQQAISEDEVKRFTIDEGLSEVQRCLVLIKKPEHD